MKVWDELLKLNIGNKEKFQSLFSYYVNKIKEGKLDLSPGEFDKGDYFLSIEENRLGSYFVHVVPKEAYSLFKKMPSNQFLGFSVVAGKYKNKDVRVSCFGVEWGKLGRSLYR